MAVKGDLADIASTRAALAGVDTAFLLVPNVADELTQAMIALNLMREAGIKRIVYLSVYRGTEYVDVPHFAGKDAVERMIEVCAIPASVLRPSYDMQNDLRQKDALTGAGLYAMPIGAAGVAMVDVRDIAELAASELLRRARADTPLPRRTIDLVGPDDLTGEILAQLWSAVLAQRIRYGGDELGAMERRMAGFAPGWLAYDLRLMVHRYQTDGAIATPHRVAALTTVLGHPLRSYQAFATEAARPWMQG